MPDQLYRFTFENSAVRGEIVILDASWQAMVERHDYSPALGQYLGEAVAAATLLSGTIKFKGSLILQLQGNGPLKTLVAQATETRQFRGMAHAEPDVPAGDLARALGEGRLVLTAESPGGERYQGIVGVEGERLAQALESYFSDSEQLGSRVWLAADERRAAGLFLQRLPETPWEPTLAVDDDWARVCLLADTLRENELLSLSAEEILRRLFHEETMRLYEPEPVGFHCACSRERIAGALRGIGREEVESIVAEQGRVEADCEFCNAHYVFDAVDVAALFADPAAVPVPESTQ